jgi:hypothetical protein
LENVDLMLKKEVVMGCDKLTSYKPYTKADVEALDKQIMEWFDTEEKAKKYDAYIEKKQYDDLDRLYDTITDEIEKLRAQRKKALVDMNLRIPGLEIGEDNMLYHNGVLRGITKTNKTSKLVNSGIRADVFQFEGKVHRENEGACRGQCRKP